jgi:hypothetical protein
LPRSRRKTLAGQDTVVPPSVLAPLLKQILAEA